MTLLFSAYGGETPPRTWRRQEAMQNAHQWEGNTSTDVEKTFLKAL